MARTRIFNEKERCELIGALASARVDNVRKARAFRDAAEDARHREDAAEVFATATAERFELWAQLDESLIEAIRENRLVIFDEEEGEQRE